MTHRICTTALVGEELRKLTVNECKVSRYNNTYNIQCSDPYVLNQLQLSQASRVTSLIKFEPSCSIAVFNALIKTRSTLGFKL